MTRNIIEVRKPEDLIWPFEQRPYHACKNYKFKAQEEVDPFPCNIHNVNIIREEVAKVEQAFPIGTLLYWFILPHELIGRCNAHANYYNLYGDTDEDKEVERKHKLHGSVVFSGKRANIHPAMTRFLVSHEYGHQVDYWISKVMEDTGEKEGLRPVYAKSYGIDYSDAGYGGGRYHNTITEMIADEFRVVVMGRDKDFWQHDRIPNPADNAERIEFWNNLKQKYTFKDE